jgi:outer membrane murein-binding lipoprotein Lpp
MAGMLIGIAALALAGCGSSDGPGAFMVDPGRYTNYHCNDLATRAKELAARQLELQGLIDKASESGGGAVIGSLAYRSDYDAAVADGKLVQRDAAAKNCGFMPNSLSDHTIR